MFNKIISRFITFFVCGGIVIYFTAGGFLLVIRDIVRSIIRDPLTHLPYWALIVAVCIIAGKIGGKIGTWIKNH
jgi:hypothetical protein